MNSLVNAADTISEWTGRFAAWVFFILGFCITYEVVMRYVFTAPTVWVDEVARIGQVWATYLAAAFALKHREMISIDIAFRKPGTIGRKCADTFSLAIILIFCLVTIRYGFDLWLRATLRGHTTDTYLALPLWFTQASVWTGFALLALQSVAEAVKIWRPVGPAREVGDRA
jgi:TRAP-type C4-dicarboxylate transport system permease small subunit